MIVLHPVPESYARAILIGLAVVVGALIIALVRSIIRLSRLSRKLAKHDKENENLYKLNSAMQDLVRRGYPDWWISTMFKNQIDEVLKDKQ